MHGHGRRRQCWWSLALLAARYPRPLPFFDSRATGVYCGVGVGTMCTCGTPPVLVLGGFRAIRRARKNFVPSGAKFFSGGKFGGKRGLRWQNHDSGGQNGKTQHWLKLSFSSRRSFWHARRTPQPPGSARRRRPLFWAFFKAYVVPSCGPVKSRCALSNVGNHLSSRRTERRSRSSKRC